MSLNSQQNILINVTVRIFGFLILAIAVELISNGTLELLKTAAPNLRK